MAEELFAFLLLCDGFAYPIWHVLVDEMLWETSKHAYCLSAAGHSVVLATSA